MKGILELVNKVKLSNACLWPILLLAFLFACNDIRAKKKKGKWLELEVTAFAYNSVPAQTDQRPNIAAWGDTLIPGMRCIAVSRDLISKGLHHNTKVRIPSLEGIYLVKDKMHHRWHNKIDVYMGEDVEKAKQWGRKKITIKYYVPDSVLSKQQTTMK